MSVAMAAKIVFSWPELGWLKKSPGEATWVSVWFDVIAGLKAARARGMVTIGLTGRGGAMAGLCDHLLAVASDETPRIQQQGRAKRAEVEKELVVLEDDLRKMLRRWRRARAT